MDAAPAALTPEGVAAAGHADPARQPQNTGSLSKRMSGVAALWSGVLLLGGGLALDRVLVSSVTNNFDDQLNYVLTAMIASAEIDPVGEVRLVRPLGDQRFLEPNSGLYYQISGGDYAPYPHARSGIAPCRSTPVRPISSRIFAM